MAKATTVATAVIATPLYLGVMVWGEGGWSAFAAKPAVVAVCGLTLASGVASIFTDASLSHGVREDKADYRTLIWLILVNLVGGVGPAFFDRWRIWPIDGEPARWVGVAIYGVGVIARMAPVFVLGRRFSGLVAIQPDHELATTGLYGLIRNPSYLALLVMTLGWGLAFNSWIGVACTVLMIPPLINRIEAEEAMLASQFGEPFQAWRARTWRLVPYVY